MKREYSMLMRSQLEMGKLAEGGIKVTRSYNKGSSSKGVEEHVYRLGDEVVMNEPMRTGKDVNKGKLGVVGADVGVDRNGFDVELIGVGKVATYLGERELELGLEKAESVVETASTNTPLRMGMKMCKNVGLNSSSDQIVPTIPGNLGMMHRFVLTKDVLPDGAELHYVVRGMKRLAGFTRDGGIYCTHCHNVVSPSQFEIHAGYASRRKPYDNIFTSNGLSLHKLANAIAIAAGRVHGSAPRKEITQRCIRIVEPLPDIGGCAICSDHDFTKKAFDDRTVIICDQCEKEYHVGCLREKQMTDLKAVPEGEWFCCKQCNNIYSTLEMFIAMGDLFLAEYFSNFVKMKAAEQVIDFNYKPDIKWRLLNGKRATEVTTKKLLSDAVSIFNNRFDPIADSTTASVDLIPYLVNGRHFKGQDYRGMHCAIFMVNSVVVSAAIFRVFGEEVAEIPLVATKSDCQRKGYFQSLFFCILGLLQSLDVKNLVLPAADEAESFWKDRFGFSKLDREQLYNLKKHHQHMMIFEETSILHKSITKFEV